MQTAHIPLTIYNITTRTKTADENKNKFSSI